MTVSITIRGIPELQRKLGQNWTSVLEPPMQRAVLLVQRDMADYPQQRPGSSYVRTGTLGRTWTTEVTEMGNGVQGKVGNVTEYAPLVQSKRFQSLIHRGRWQTDEDVLQRDMPRIVRLFQDAIDEALR